MSLRLKSLTVTGISLVVQLLQPVDTHQWRQLNASSIASGTMQHWAVHGLISGRYAHTRHSHGQQRGTIKSNAVLNLMGICMDSVQGKRTPMLPTANLLIIL